MLFCFGEIDCRCHVKKHLINGDYKNIIDSLVLKYKNELSKVSKLVSNQICIYNIIPPLKRLNKNMHLENNFPFPFLYDDIESKLYIEYFNLKLKELCIDENYIFFDVYEKYLDNERYLNPKYSDGIIHIVDNIFIKEFMRLKLNIIC